MTAGSMKSATALTQDLVVERWRVAFALHVGQGRPHSFDTLAAATGIPARTLRSYYDREATPPVVNFLKISAVLPPEFTEALLELAGLCGVRAVSGSAPSARRIVHDMAARLTVIAGAIERHGEVDHRHRAEVIAKFRGLVCEMEAFIAGLEAGAP